MVLEVALLHRRNFTNEASGLLSASKFQQINNITSAYHLHFKININTHSSSQLPPVFSCDFLRLCIGKTTWPLRHHNLLMHHDLLMDFQNLVATQALSQRLHRGQVPCRTQFYEHCQEATMGKPSFKHTLHMWDVCLGDFIWDFTR